MSTFSCSNCHRVIQAQGPGLPAHFPFCSERCKLIDLGRWLNGSYHMPGKELGEEPQPNPDEPDSSDQKSS